MENRYLGDGVYASFDGYQIWLAVNHHTNLVIAIDFDVFHSLMQYGAEAYAPILNNLRNKPAEDSTTPSMEREGEDPPVDIF